MAAIAAGNSAATVAKDSSCNRRAAAKLVPCFASSMATFTVENSVRAAAFASISNGF